MNIPQNLEELKSLKQWVNYVRLWDDQKDGGRGGYDKPPINPKTLRDAMPNKAATWADYNTAAANIGKTATHKDIKHKDAQGNAPIVVAPIEGTGFILAGGYCGIDFDHVIDEDGNLAPFAARILERLDTYAEISPSGHGLHLLLFCGDTLRAAKAKEVEIYKEVLSAGATTEEALRQAKGRGDFGKQFLLDAKGEPTDEEGKAYELEIYFYVWGGRYFTITGNVYQDKPINRTKDAELKQILDEYKAKAETYKAAKQPASSVGTHYTTGRAATGEDDKRMIESALRVINPGSLNGYREWAPIMSALCELGYSCSYAEEWSSGRLSGTVNPINNPASNERRWNRGNFRLRDGAANAAGIIINAAKRFSWTPAQAFDEQARAAYGRSLYSEEARAAYGRSLHTEEERRQYGRDLNAAKWTEEDEANFRKWIAKKKEG